jgi:hypothetical protein
MRKRWREFGRYLLARANEGSTWRGIALLAAVAGARLQPDHTEAIVLVGLAVSGIIGALFPERKEP